MFTWYKGSILEIIFFTPVSANFLNCSFLQIQRNDVIELRNMLIKDTSQSIGSWAIEKVCFTLEIRNKIKVKATVWRKHVMNPVEKLKEKNIIKPWKPLDKTILVFYFLYLTKSPISMLRHEGGGGVSVENVGWSDITWSVGKTEFVFLLLMNSFAFNVKTSIKMTRWRHMAIITVILKTRISLSILQLSPGQRYQSRTCTRKNYIFYIILEIGSNWCKMDLKYDAKNYNWWINKVNTEKTTNF